MRLGYLCMQSEFSTRPLRALLEAGHDVRFVLRPLSREQRREPLLLAPDEVDGVLHLDPVREPFLVAETAGVPCWLAGDASSEAVRELMVRERVDAVVICFFNQLLRPALLDALPLGAVNAHPSLLPEFRGPAPLFWTFRGGREETGVTVHRVGVGEDDGDVFNQHRVPLPFGVRGEEIVPQLAEAAAAGVVAAVAALARGEQPAIAQDHARATRAPRPDARAATLDTEMSARQIYSWVRGVGRWNRLRFHAAGIPLRVLDACGLETESRVPGDYALVGDRLTLRCQGGSVTLRVAGGAVRAA